MAQAIDLAERGRGFTRTNPLVGALVVDDCGEIISSGYHERIGGAHAEAIALERAGRRARGATLVVNLEPCCHAGRTGPCTRAIIDACMEHVVIAHRDPDVRVNGQGIEQLRRAGIEVTEGVQTRAATKLNEHYLGFKANGRPFVTLKLALSLDGRIADADGQSHWITGPQCRAHAHALRARHDAIVIGAGTARNDNPRLTVRDAGGPSPRRFVLKGKGAIAKDLNVFAGAEPGISVGTNGADWQVLPDSSGLPSVAHFLKRLADEEYCSLLVEGGARLAASFMRERLVDKVVLYYGPLLLGGGKPAFEGWQSDLQNAPRLRDVEIETFADGFAVSGYPEWT
jgi:diaminohydroxyphosphoribosylaminopyrimidine deaminase/5-amino-6-(5-phosphoribosylamino)uracil reductase